jgi:DNA-binding Lrp family transcriptional regulator
MMGRLDETDARILKELDSEPRVPVLELSRRLGLARATVQARLDRMEAAGVLRGARLDVDLDKIGYGVLAFVRLEIAQGQLAQIRELLESMPEIVEAHGVTGEGDVHCRVACRDHGELQEVLLRLGGSPWVVRTSSSIALSEVVRYRIVPVVEQAAADRRPLNQQAAADRRPLNQQAPSNQQVR